MMNRSFILIITCFILSVAVNAQSFFTPVHPSLKDQALYDAVRSDFKPSRIFDYGNVRDTLFLKIDAVNRNLSCIYTNLTLPIPEGTDPTTAVFLNGNINGINTEHVYPLSLGTENTPAQSDMHHLYPSRVKTNADRGNLPYGDSPDANTQRWYKEKEELTNKPSSNINDYSELGLTLFEPRESAKGDLARSMFYIYTIYRDEVTSIDDQYFLKQRQSLCEWHFADPVDEKEWKRTYSIAAYQGNVNPFVLDCSLAGRMYCDMFSSACSLLNSEDKQLPIHVHYDATSHAIILQEVSFDQMFMYDMTGRMVKQWNSENGNKELSLVLNPLPSGMYCLVFLSNHITQSIRIMIP